MSVDVVYQGLPIAKEAGFRIEGGGIFVEVDGPMPVATRLTIVSQGHRLDGWVARITEGVGPGMVVVPTDGRPLPEWITRPRQPEPEPVAAEPEPEPVTAAPEPVAVAPEPVAAEPEPVAVAPEPVAAEQAAAPAVEEPAAPAVPAIEEAAAAPEPSSATPPSGATPPYESTQEIAIPSLDEGDGGAPRPSGKKKKGSRRR